MFDNRLTILREEMKLTKKEMAEKLNLPYTTYSNYENDEREPNSETLILIAQTCGVSVDYLLGLTNIRKKENEAICETLGLSEISIEHIKKIAGLHHNAKQKNNYCDIEALDYLLSSEHYESVLLGLSLCYEIIKYDRYVQIDDLKERQELNKQLNDFLPTLDKMHMFPAGKYDMARLHLEETLALIRHMFTKELNDIAES